MIWLDIVVVAIILVTVIIGFKRGAAKTLLNLIATVVSFFTAILLSNTLSQWVYDTFLKSTIIKNVTASIEQNGLTDAANSIAEVFTSFPKFINSALSYFGYNLEALNSSITSAVKDAPKQGVEIIEGAVSPVIVSLIAIILTIVFFILMLVITKQLVKLLSKVFEIPGLRLLNRLAGGVLGVLQGAVLVFVFVWILRLSLPMISPQTNTETEKQISQTVVFKYFYDTDLIKSDNYYNFDF